jgi:uncharacterized membrane protein YeiH
MNFATTLVALDLAGVLVFAISGAIAGARRKMDIVGMFALALVTATGGGTLRSLLIGDLPVPFLRTPWPLALTLAATLLTYFAEQAVEQRFTKPLRLFDALGLGVFLSTGMAVSLNLGQPWWAALFLGCVTAVFGGVLRDLLRQEVPLVFQPAELYTTAALIGGGALLAVDSLSGNRQWAMVAGAVVTITVRVFALYFRWRTAAPPL